LVLAQTRQAKDNYRLSREQLEQTQRTAVNNTRQSYLGIIAGISKIQADEKAIKSAISSYEGMEAGYRVGTEILINVLDQQRQVLNNQKLYAHDRYAYVMSFLTLKQAAGTLCPDDLAAINAYLHGGELFGPEIPKNKA
jgi:outer membrane protein